MSDPSMWPRKTLGEMLTDAQLGALQKVYPDVDAMTAILAKDIEAISKRCGQEMDARYLAYACIHAFNTASAHHAEPEPEPMVRGVEIAPRFPLGDVRATPGAHGAFDQAFLITCLKRHAHGDWGDMSPEDVQANDDAFLQGDARILSAYVHPKTSRKVYVITEADRSCTTFLLPDEY